MSWTYPIRLSELARGAMKLRLEPDAAQRAEIAKRLGLEGLPALSAEILVKPWLDGAEITGRLDGVVEQICGLTLDPFEQPVDNEIEVRLVPAGSPNAPTESPQGEIEMDLETPDPPDVLEGEVIDLAEYVVEHLALVIDPFPRKPGAVFEPPEAEPEESPFAVLKRLKDKEA